jgi:FlaG/FlaF family flagellin (archaellin)
MLGGKDGGEDMQRIKNDDGVSATVGVILMVMITVVLAAFIAAFSFTMTNSMPVQHTLGTLVDWKTTSIVYVQTVSGDMTLLKTGGADHHTRAETSYTCLVNGVRVNPVTSEGVEIPDDGTGNFDASACGDRMYFLASQGDDVTVVAHFTDGSTAMVHTGKLS